MKLREHYDALYQAWVQVYSEAHRLIARVGKLYCEESRPQTGEEYPFTRDPSIR